MPSPTPGLNDLRDAFRLLDRDQNGTLDLQEPVMARFGP
jgi:Ca2+-binding EF-hand superfamily protein